MDLGDRDVLLLGPRPQLTADIFRSVVDTDDIRFAAPFDDAFQRPNDPLDRQREVDLDARPLAVEIIDDVQGPEWAAVSELVGHEVHGPGPVALLGYSQRLRALSYKTLPGLDPEVQFQEAIDAVGPLVVPSEAFDIAQTTEAQLGMRLMESRLPLPRRTSARFLPAIAHTFLRPCPITVSLTGRTILPTGMLRKRSEKSSFIKAMKRHVGLIGIAKCPSPRPKPFVMMSG